MGLKQAGYRFESAGVLAAAVVPYVGAEAFGALLVDAELGLGLPPQVRDDPVVRACLACFAGATHALIEVDYFDLDHRSVESRVSARRYTSRSPTTHRVTFLDLSKHSRRRQWPSSLPEVLDLLWDGDYLGYLVLTKDVTGIISRAIIPPPTVLDWRTADGRVQATNASDVKVADHVRTLVSEQIAIFGRLCQVSGVPFAMQDGSVLRCGHVSAWIAHYIAVLRGLCQRWPSGRIHDGSPTVDRVARSFPSQGPSLTQLVALFDEIGLPVDALRITDLWTHGRKPEWYDRRSLWVLDDRLRDAVAGVSDATFEDGVRELEAKAEAETSDAETSGELLSTLRAFWARETLTRTVCQYLNSGFPSLLLVDGHSMLIIGYLRRKDLVRASPAWDSGPGVAQASAMPIEESDVYAFIVSDDQGGPYEVIAVDDVLAKIQREAYEAGVLTPLPHGVWLPGEWAESQGAIAFANATTQVVQALQADRRSMRARHSVQSLSEPDLNQYLAAARRLKARFAPRAARRCDVSLRSYVVPGRDFKEGFARRCSDRYVVAQVRLAHLPKYVWVVEVMDRPSRNGDLGPEAREASVIGEVVLDATGNDEEESQALVVHLPGAVQVSGPNGAIGKWHVSGQLSGYGSGRYHGSKDWMTDATAVVARWKNAFRS